MLPDKVAYLTLSKTIVSFRLPFRERAVIDGLRRGPTRLSLSFRSLFLSSRFFSSHYFLSRFIPKKFDAPRMTRPCVGGARLMNPPTSSSSSGGGQRYFSLSCALLVCDGLVRRARSPRPRRGPRKFFGI